MSFESNLQTLVTDIGTQFKSVRTSAFGTATGDASGLTTTATNLVSAVNELDAEITALTTTVVAEGTSLYFTDARAIAAPITGFTSGAGVLAATDTILESIQKLDGNITAASGSAVTSVNGQSGPGAVTISTTDITEGTNLYFTDARSIASPLTGYTPSAGSVSATDTIIQAIQKVDANLTGLVTTDVAEGTNLYYTTARFDTALGTKDTGDLSEGTNLYFTTGRVDTQVATLSVDVLADVDTTTATPSTGDHLSWNGSSWVPDSPSGALINDSAASSTQTYSSNKITTDISTAVSALVDSSPAVLDTLNELAAAIGDDAAFSTTVTTALNNRVRFDAAQTLSTGEKTQANTNLGLGATIETRDFAADFAAALL